MRYFLKNGLAKSQKDLFLAFSSHFFYKVVGYLVLMILSRYLAKDEMGEFFFAAALATFFVMLTELGTDTRDSSRLFLQGTLSLSLLSSVKGLDVWGMDY